ncbi:MAG: DUF1080 domain-containing protein [Planctomycetes bacterium]|nr:DUF1080 domain-containing protein [Planctomycetota bacterium]
MRRVPLLVLALLPNVWPAAARAQDWRPLFDGRTFAGWRGQEHRNPYELAAMSEAKRDAIRAQDDASMRAHWRIADGELINDGEGAYLTTVEEFGDAEYELEYRTVALADSGIYLRGCPQVQIWDTTEAGGKWKIGADKGSGGLWNNKRHERFPPAVADRPFGEWNTLRIRQVGATTWVELNGVTTVDGVVMDNYWDYDRPLPRTGPLQLQTHGGEIRFRNLRVRTIGADEANALLAGQDRGGFEPIFDGETFAGWQGATGDYEIVDGALQCRRGQGGNLFTTAEYGDFVARIEFRLPPGGNNGLAIRYPGEGTPAYTGFELQVLDNTAEKYAELKPWQYHGSVYGVAPAARGYLRPVGQWNFQEVTVAGSRVRVVLNGTEILDADLAGASSQLEGHVGKDRALGHFGFCGHDDPVAFRAIAIRRLDRGR